MEGSFWRKRAKRPFSGRRGPATRLVKGVIAALAREVGRTDEAAGAYLRGQDYYRKIESAGADNGEKGGR